MQISKQINNNRIAIINGSIQTMSQAGSLTGSILTDGGKIQKIVQHDLGIDQDKALQTLGLNGKEEGLEVIEAAGRWILPGFIDAHCHVGIGEEIYRFEGDDINEMTDPITPELRTIDAINPEDEGFRDARLGGITAAFTCPGSANVIGGTGVVVKTAGRIVDEMIIREPAGLKIAFGENPKFVYGDQKKMPMTRMATAALLRQTLIDGQNYKDKLEQGRKDRDKLPERELSMEVINMVLDRKIPLRAHAHRADDMMTAIRIAKEFQVDIVLEHCTEGHKIADIIAGHKLPAVVGPSLSNRAKQEMKDITFRTPGILAKAGVKVALMTDHSVTPIQYLPLCASLAVKNGMAEEDALKAITIWSAEILGVQDRIGSLAQGKDADIVIWSEKPLCFDAEPQVVIINGQVVKPE